MNLYLLIVFAALLVSCDCVCNNTIACERDKAFSLLDVATDIIQRVKENYVECPVDKLTSLKPIDCEDLLVAGYNKSGKYSVWPRSRVLEAETLEVYCDMETDGGGWTVIQKRGNFSRGKEFFYQDWASYKSGFGSIEEDFWLGNDPIFALTNQRQCSVRIDLVDVQGNKRYALYDSFWIDDENHTYTLHVRDYSGNAGDSLKGHDNVKFSTKDVQNDNNGKKSCASIFKGGWWYNACHTANLNGMYLDEKHGSWGDGVNWLTWKGPYESLATTEIKIRSKNFRKKIAAAQCEN